MVEYFPQQIEGKVAIWAKSHPTIQAVVEVGSQVRGDHPADQWSDLDLILLITEPLEQGLANEWVREISLIIGDVWSIAQETGSNFDWFPLGNIIFGKQKVDIVCTVIPEEVRKLKDMEAILPNLPYAYVYNPSCKIIYDYFGVPRKIVVTSGKYVPRIPGEAELINKCRLFWMELVHLAQIFNRGEYWRAAYLQSQCLDKYLLKLIEWHATVYQDKERIWPRGRFLEEWADPRIVSDLQKLQFALNRSAFGETNLMLFNLHRWMVLEICANTGFLFPFEESASYCEWLKELSKSYKK